MTRILLFVLYPPLLLAWVVNVALRRDRLRLQNARTRQSHWVVRAAQPDIVSYFSEDSCVEGGEEWSAARPVIRLLRGIARLSTPRRRQGEGVYKASAEREQGIPDEVYTLW
jgi:hypothetical protein